MRRAPCYIDPGTFVECILAQLQGFVPAGEPVHFSMNVTYKRPADPPEENPGDRVKVCSLSDQGYMPSRVEFDAVMPVEPMGRETQQERQS